MTEATRTLLFGIFVMARRPLTASQVIALAQPLRISATNVKSHLTRMVREGALRRTGPVRLARYAPSFSQAMVAEGIHARLEATQESWDRSWLLLTLRMPSRRSGRDRLRAELWFDGFRPWAPELFVRPAWPRRWALERARRHLAKAPGLCVCGALLGSKRTGSIKAADLAALYDLDALDREASRLARRISRLPIRNRSAGRAFATRLKAGGEVARLVGHDPRLPPVLWGGRGGMRRLIRTFRRFDSRVAPIAQRFLDHVILNR